MSSLPLLVAIFGLGLGELGIICVLLLIFWGGKKLPGLARGIARMPVEFRKGKKNDDSMPADG